MSHLGPSIVSLLFSTSISVSFVGIAFPYPVPPSSHPLFPVDPIPCSPSSHILFPEFLSSVPSSSFPSFFPSSLSGRPHEKNKWLLFLFPLFEYFFKNKPWKIGCKVFLNTFFLVLIWWVSFFCLSTCDNGGNFGLTCLYLINGGYFKVIISFSGLKNPTYCFFFSFKSLFDFLMFFSYFSLLLLHNIFIGFLLL